MQIYQHSNIYSTMFHNSFPPKSGPAAAAVASRGSFFRRLSSSGLYGLFVRADAIIVIDMSRVAAMTKDKIFLIFTLYLLVNLNVRLICKANNRDTFYKYIIVVPY